MYIITEYQMQQILNSQCSRTDVIKEIQEQKIEKDIYYQDIEHIENHKEK